MSAFRPLAFAAMLFAAATAVAALTPPRHNLVIFVADGLRSGVVTPQTAPVMADLRAKGVDFHNSHSLFPTVTTANASAIATGHGLGDTGDFANSVFVGDPPLGPVAPSRIADYENDETLVAMNERFGGNYLGETTLLEAARRGGFQTAAVGKIGPASIQSAPVFGGDPTVILDDRTGRGHGMPLQPAIEAAIRAAGLEPQTPDRTANAQKGDFRGGGTLVSNSRQQDWFVDVVTRVLLPRFKADGRPFVVVFWSRDPDGTQHYNGDSLNKVVPGINGPTSMAGIRDADNDLGLLRKALKELGLEDTTDIVVTADHGFSTESRQSATSPAARDRYPDVVPGFVPPGFAALDLARALGLQVFDTSGQPLGAKGHPFGGSALLARDPAHPEVMIGGNGGSDLIWLEDRGDRAFARRVVNALIAQDYVAAVFVDDALGPVPGTLPMSAVGLEGSARTPHPQIVVSFRSYSTGCAQPELCAAEVAESDLQQGQGQHGSLSRANTHNFMAAIGPDFRAGFLDPAPVSNADWAPTLAKVLGLDLGGVGKLKGRVMSEALLGGGPVPPHARHVTASAPAKNGFATILHWQSVGTERYYDSAGAPGRVVR